MSRQSIINSYHKDPRYVGKWIAVAGTKDAPVIAAHEDFCQMFEQLSDNHKPEHLNYQIYFIGSAKQCKDLNDWHLARNLGLI